MDTNIVMYWCKILKHELPIDIYGRGCINYIKFHSPYIKGNFENLEPYENYDFHIAIENVNQIIILVKK